MKRIDRIDLRFPEGRAKCLTMSWDDGWENDIPLVEMMKKYGIAGTFNLCPGLFEQTGRLFGATKVINYIQSEESTLKTYADSPLIEVASHGYTHTYMDRMPLCDAAYEMTASRRALESMFGKMIRGCAYSYGTYNADVARVLRDCGFVYARALRSTYNFDLPEDWLVLEPTCRHIEAQFPELTEQFLTMTVKKDPKMFYVWGHSYELDRVEGRWEAIEAFFRKISGKDEIWYATNIEICEYVLASKQLVFSADHMKVYNPTVTDIWLALNTGKETVKIPAGQTVDLGE